MVSIISTCLIFWRVGVWRKSCGLGILFFFNLFFPFKLWPERVDFSIFCWSLRFFKDYFFSVFISEFGFGGKKIFWEWNIFFGLLFLREMCYRLKLHWLNDLSYYLRIGIYTRNRKKKLPSEIRSLLSRSLSGLCPNARGKIRLFPTGVSRRHSPLDLRT